MSINTLSLCQEEVLLVGKDPLEGAKTALQFQEWFMELEPKLHEKLAFELGAKSALSLKGYYHYLTRSPKRWGWKAKLVALLFSDI